MQFDQNSPVQPDPEKKDLEKSQKKIYSLKDLAILKYIFRQKKMLFS